MTLHEQYLAFASASKILIDEENRKYEALIKEHNNIEDRLAVAAVAFLNRTGVPVAKEDLEFYFSDRGVDVGIFQEDKLVAEHLVTWEKLNDPT